MPADTSVEHVEGVILVILIVATILAWAIRRLARSRPDFRIGMPFAVAFGIRLLAIVGISATGLESSLRGGDETTFLDEARILATHQLGRDYFPHGVYQLHVVLFALQIKLGFLTVGAMRINQVGLALLGYVLMIAAVYDLGGPRAARLGAWLLAFEPASIFFNSEIHKESLMELSAGMMAFGGVWLWKRLDLRGILICAVAGFIGVETRSYAGWFLVCSGVLILLHAAIRGMHRPMRAMPIIYAIIVAGVLVTPTLLAATSSKQLQILQRSESANATGQANGPDSDNLALEDVDFSSRGAIITNLPNRIRELVLEPYPWQVADPSQRFGAIGTLVAYAVLIFLARYAWLNRGHVFERAAPLLYPLLFLLVAYSLAVGNAGTGFRYRSHLVTLGIAALATLRAHAVAEPATETSRRRRARGRSLRRPSGKPATAHDF